MEGGEPLHTPRLKPLRAAPRPPTEFPKQLELQNKQQTNKKILFSKMFRSSKKEPKIAAAQKGIDYQGLHKKLGLGNQSLYNLPGSIKAKYNSSENSEKQKIVSTLKESGFSQNNILRFKLPSMIAKQTAELTSKLQSALKSRANNATTLNLLAVLPQKMNIPEGRKDRPTYTETGNIIAKAAKLSKKTNNPEIEERAKELRKYLSKHGNTISNEHRKQVSNELNVLGEKNLNNQTVVLGKDEKLFKKSAFQNALDTAKTTLTTRKISNKKNRSAPNLKLFGNDANKAEKKKNGTLMETSSTTLPHAPIQPPPPAPKPPPPPVLHSNRSDLMRNIASGVKLRSVKSSNSTGPAPSNGNTRNALLAAIRARTNLKPPSIPNGVSSRQAPSKGSMAALMDARRKAMGENEKNEKNENV